MLTAPGLTLAVNDEVLNNTGVDVVKALQPLGVTYIVIERVTVLPPSGTVWRVLAMGPTVQTRQQQIGQTSSSFSETRSLVGSGVTKVRFVTGSVTQSA